MFKKLLPRGKKFFDLFNQHAETVLEGISLFKTILKTDPEKESLTGQLKAIENRADDVAHAVFELLNTVFVTPAASIIGNSFAGIPVSTTHTITGGIIGVDSVHRLSAVRWGIAGNIVLPWVLNIPGAAVISGGAYLITASMGAK